MVIPIVIGALGTVTKGLVQGLGVLEITERVETVQATSLLRSVRIPRKVLETWGDLLSLKLYRQTISERWRKKNLKEEEEEEEEEGGGGGGGGGGG